MSYGVNAAQGLQPRQYLNGTPWSGQTSEYSIASGYATDLFCGDPIVGLADGTIGRQAGGAATAIIGVFWGVKYTDVNGQALTLPYWLANTVTQGALVAQAAIVDDANVLYDIQTDPTIVGGTAFTDLNSTANLVTGAGSQRTGQSGFSVGAAANVQSNQVRILRFTPVPGNAPGIRYNNVLVLLNNDPYKGGFGTANQTGAAGV